MTCHSFSCLILLYVGLPENKMLPQKKEQRVFSNGKLRDQWEQRAQNIAVQRKQEAEFREKSALKL